MDARRAWSPLASRGEILLAATIVGVVALLVVPVPAVVIDVLLASSLALGALLLGAVVYARDVRELATFPTILLLTTLFRLAIAVGAARLILLRGEAGALVRAFGGFLVQGVQGSFVVGVTSFVIVALAHYLVVARGAERVAEVAARFALDALPGRQMAIDAELREGGMEAGWGGAGAVDEARAMRDALARESQLYGAMDGAMKLVRGEVIAEALVLAVTLVGGAIVGVVQRGMPIGEAARRYGLLAIGAGMATLVPSLLGATAAGILVTRIGSSQSKGSRESRESRESRGSRGSAMGVEVGRELFGAPRAIVAAAAVVAAIGLFPGVPLMPFLAIAVALGLLAARAIARTSGPITVGPSDDRSTGASDLTARLGSVAAWGVDVSDDLAHLTRAGRDDEAPALARALGEVVDALYATRGVPLSPPRIGIVASLPPSTVRVLVRDVPASVFHVPDASRARGDEKVARRGAPETETDARRLRAIADEARRVLESRAHELVGITETQRILDALEEIDGPLVRLVVPKAVSVATLGRVLGELVREGVTIRDARPILEAIAQIAPPSSDPAELAEAARRGLRRVLTHSLSGGADAIAVHVVDRAIEEVVRGGVTRAGGRSTLALAPSAAGDIVRSVVSGVGSAEHGRVVLLAAPDVRRFLREVLAGALPEVRVTTPGELDPDVRLEVVGRVVPV